MIWEASHAAGDQCHIGNGSLLSLTRAHVSRAFARYLAQPVGRPAARGDAVALSDTAAAR